MIPEAPSIIADRYEVHELLGRGGTAAVYRAFDRRFRVARAVKLLVVAPRYRAGLRRRLEREAQSMAAMDNPHLLRVYDIGAEGDRDYVVMDLAEGGSLADVLDAHGPMPPIVAMEYIVHVLAALDAAHAASVIHRDVKPQNVLLTQDNIAKLADFGIALFDREDIERHTKVGVMMGSLAYMSPEQRQDASSVGPAADIYATGGTLYNLLTNASPLDLYLAAPSSPRWQGIHPGLQNIIRRAMLPKTSSRYPSAREMARDIIGLMPSMEATTAPVRAPSAATEGAIRALVGDNPQLSASPQHISLSAIDEGAYPLTWIPGDADINAPVDTAVRPTIAPSTRLPELLRSVNWVPGLLAAVGLTLLGLALSQLGLQPTTSATHQPILLAQAPAISAFDYGLTARFASTTAQRYLDSPPTAAAAPTRTPAASCDLGSGSSSTSGTWKGQRTIMGASTVVTLAIGGSAGALRGCSQFTFFSGRPEVHTLTGSIDGATIKLREAGGYTYELTQSGDRLSGFLNGPEGRKPASFRRVQ
ncbi:MAG: serine/threonine protein kinase [Myxococcota bacterium]|jgi:serine/threonine protein kinase